MQSIVDAQVTEVPREHKIDPLQERTIMWVLSPVTAICYLTI